MSDKENQIEQNSKDKQEQQSQQSPKKESLIDSLKGLMGVALGFCFLAAFAYGVLHFTSSNRAIGESQKDVPRFSLADTLARDLGLEGANITRFKRLYDRYSEQKEELMKYWRVEFESVLSTQQVEDMFDKEDSLKTL